jgi:hypothetical protein
MAKLDQDREREDVITAAIQFCPVIGNRLTRHSTATNKQSLP